MIWRARWIGLKPRKSNSCRHRSSTQSRDRLYGGRTSEEVVHRNSAEAADLFAAFRARADLPQMLPRINPRRMPIAPVNPDGIVPHRFHIQHLQRGLIHLKRRRRRLALRLPRRRPMRTRAGRTRALIAQIRQAVIARMPVLPIDLDALRFRNGDVFGVRRAGHVSSAAAPRRARPRCAAWRPPASPDASCRARPRSSPPARRPSTPSRSWLPGCGY